MSFFSFEGDDELQELKLSFSIISRFSFFYNWFFFLLPLIFSSTLLVILSVLRVMMKKRSWSWQTGIHSPVFSVNDNSRYKKTSRYKNLLATWGTPQNPGCGEIQQLWHFFDPLFYTFFPFPLFFFFSSFLKIIEFTRIWNNICALYGIPMY